MEKKLPKILSYILQFIDSIRSLVSSLSNLLNNLFEGTHKIKCKYERNNKNKNLRN